MKKLEDEWKRQKEAARRILQVSIELHLTWDELEKIIERIKRNAYISDGSVSSK